VAYFEGLCCRLNESRESAGGDGRGGPRAGRARPCSRGAHRLAVAAHCVETIAALVAEIGSEPDKEAERESATHAGTIRCVVGRSELDFAAATLLAHLLSRKGCRAEVLASPAVSRGNIGNFGTEGVSALVVCYVDFAGATAPLRFLLRRLRQRLPEAQLFVAVWPQDHPLQRSAERSRSDLRNVLTAGSKFMSGSGRKYAIRNEQNRTGYRAGEKIELYAFPESAQFTALIVSEARAIPNNPNSVSGEPASARTPKSRKDRRLRHLRSYVSAGRA
jgi:hypothetical protein